MKPNLRSNATLRNFLMYDKVLLVLVLFACTRTSVATGNIFLQFFPTSVIVWHNLSGLLKKKKKWHTIQSLPSDLLLLHNTFLQPSIPPNSDLRSVLPLLHHTLTLFPPPQHQQHPCSCLHGSSLIGVAQAVPQRPHPPHRGHRPAHPWHPHHDRRLAWVSTRRESGANRIRWEEKGLKSPADFRDIGGQNYMPK